jgi:sugar (pentulose or hexulose) kinase
MKSCSIAGGLTPEAARNVGLRDGAPVAVGCGDNQASFAGSVADSSASVLVNIGTGAQVSAWVPTYLAVQTVDTRPHLDGGFLLVGAPLCGGLSYALLRIFFDMVGKQIFRLGEEEDFYDTMTALAASAPSGADGLRCEPLFTGTRLEPDRRAAFSGITPANFTPGHFARAVLEGIAEQVHLHYADMLEAGIKPRTQLVCSGNGVRRNALLAAILCKTFGMPMRLTATQEEAAFGAALVAAVGIGEFPDLRTACRLVQYHS